MHKINTEWLEDIDSSYFSKYVLWFKRHFKENKRSALKVTINLMKCIKAVEFYRMVTYGGLAFEDESRLSGIYDRHIQAVLSYFKDRPNDLLVINITEGEGWEKLCPFLSKPIPSTAFPNIHHKRHNK